MHGELWGISNLLKLTADRVETQSIIAAQRENEDQFRIERCDMAELGALPSCHLHAHTSAHHMCR